MKLLCCGSVVAPLNVAVFIVKSTGEQVVEKDETHIWYFDGAGKFARFCNKTDTLLHWQALQSA